MNLEIREFKSPFDYSIPTLFAYTGYIYGTCARKLFYANETKKVGFTKQELQFMEDGTSMHKEKQDQMIRDNPDMSFEAEKYTRRDLPEPVLGIESIRAKLDLYSEAALLAIEIKMMYSKKAYYQISIEKFVNPKLRFEMLQYAYPEYDPNYILKLKADYEMSKVYVGRIITALTVKPPRFPDSKYSHPTCAHCLYRERCYTESSISWELYKLLSQHAIDGIRNVDS